MNYLTEEKHLLEFYLQKLLFMESQYLQKQGKHLDSLSCLLKGIQSGSVFSLKLRLAYLDQLTSTFRALDIQTHISEIQFLKSVYSRKQTRHFFLIVDETSQFIYQFKYVQDFLKILIGQIQFGDILSIFSFDQTVKVRHTRFVTRSGADLDSLRRDLVLEFNEKLDQMRRSKMFDRKDVYANLQEILIPFLTMDIDSDKANLESGSEINSDLCLMPSDIQKFKKHKKLNNYVFLFLFEGVNFEKNQGRKSQIKAMMNRFSKLSQNNNLQVCFEKTFVNFMLLKPSNVNSIQDKILNIIKASQTYFIVFYNYFVQNKNYFSKMESILKSFII